MLKLRGISKQYKTGAFTQKVLDKLDLTLRDNEFVAILGPSGSGKTTLLNIIGGLDKYDEGDLIINGISTRDFKDRDWDTYRNHTIGFVFQSYNLIPHQTVLANVELGMTIGRISGTERRERALKALEEVGLKEHVNKRPNQLSGGQMQRVVIARALVNDPDIVLADEPTGALDTDTGIQVMELLKRVAKDRLVVMVTHNPELAGDYATRIIKIKDGKIKEDSQPVSEEEMAGNDTLIDKKTRFAKRSGMSLGTSVRLSLNNLRTKFARTLLTAIAGSIGIIGIALILAISNGVNNYISDEQRSTMSSYPLTIQSQELDMSRVLDSGGNFSGTGSKDESKKSRDGLFADTSSVTMGNQGLSYKKNNLREFKKYLDDPASEINKHIGNNGITYTYNTAISVYSKDPDGKYVNTNDDPTSKTTSNLSMFSMNLSAGSNGSSASNFSELTSGRNGETVSGLIKSNYSLVSGNWPDKADEIVINLSETNSLNAVNIYQLGIITKDEYKRMTGEAENSSDDSSKEKKINDSVSSLIGREFYLIPEFEFYNKKSNGTFEKVEVDALNIQSYIDKSIRLKVVGIIKPLDKEKNDSVTTVAAYTYKLTDQLIEKANQSEIIKAQEADPDINIFTGVKFKAGSNEEKAADAKEYASKLTTREKANLFTMMTVYNQAEKGGNEANEQNPDTAYTPSAMTGGNSETYLAASLDSWLNSDPKQEDLVKIYDAYIGSNSYDEVMKKLGKVDKANPAAINIYTDSFDGKNGVTAAINAYNSNARDADKITYTDLVGLMTSSMTKIVNGITSVLIAFVSVSLVVSSIMIGIITHISVLERTKEIGILRAMGASKANISQVFNAETGMIGLASGALGIGISIALTFPMTAVMRHLMKADNISADFTPLNAIILIGISILITLIGGLIPARKAAKKDPVLALRSE